MLIPYNSRISSNYIIVIMILLNFIRTFNLDKHTEEIVVNFILKYFKDKTLIIATHNEKINEICNKFYHFEAHNLKVKNMSINS